MNKKDFGARLLALRKQKSHQNKLNAMMFFDCCGYFYLYQINMQGEFSGCTNFYYILVTICRILL